MEIINLPVFSLLLRYLSCISRLLQGYYRFLLLLLLRLLLFFYFPRIFMLVRSFSSLFVSNPILILIFSIPPAPLPPSCLSLSLVYICRLVHLTPAALPLFLYFFLTSKWTGERQLLITTTIWFIPNFPSLTVFILSHSLPIGPFQPHRLPSS